MCYIDGPCCSPLVLGKSSTLIDGRGKEKLQIRVALRAALHDIGGEVEKSLIDCENDGIPGSN
jgi:hypothetical protein